MFCVLSETQLAPSLAHSSGRIGEDVGLHFSLHLTAPPCGGGLAPLVTNIQSDRSDREKLIYFTHQIRKFPMCREMEILFFKAFITFHSLCSIQYNVCNVFTVVFLYYFKTLEPSEVLQRTDTLSG